MPRFNELKLQAFSVACARIACIFPHSMYVERLVSAHNLIKSDMRASMDRYTVNDYMIVKESMCSDAQDDPRPTIAKWLTMRARPKTCESLLKLENYKANDYVQSFFFVDYRLYLACES